MIIKCLRLIGICFLKSCIGVLTIVQIHAEIDFPVSERRIVFETELCFLFGGAEAEHQILRNTFIILTVFRVTVVQITMADYYRLHMCTCIVAIYGPQCKRFLLNFWQIAKDIFVVFAVGFCIQSHIIDSAESQHSQFVLFVEPGFQFELCIGKSRQEREPQHIKQELQVGLTHGYQIGGLFPDVPVRGQGDFGGSECGF